MDISLLIFAAVALVLIAGGIGFLYLLNRFRVKQRDRYFKSFYSTFDLHPPSTYDNDGKDYSRFARKHVRLKWRLFKLQSVLILGEANSVRVDEALALVQYFNKERKDGEFIPDFEQLGQGVFKAYFHEASDTRITFWEDELKIFKVLDDKFYIRNNHQWPVIEFKDWQPESNPRFSNVIVTELPAKTLNDYDKDRFIQVLSTTFSRHERLWKLKQIDAEGIEINSYDRASNEAKGNDAKFVITQMLDKVQTEKSRSVGFFLVKNAVHQVKAEAGTPAAISLLFGEGNTGSLLTEDGYRTFVRELISLLQTEWPGTWKSQNNLLKNGTILLKKF